MVMTFRQERTLLNTTSSVLEVYSTSRPQISIVLVKAGNKPFLLECHTEQIEEAISLFLADSLWTRVFEIEGSSLTVRGFPYHIDLADQIARTLIKGSEFQTFVESRLFDIGIESGFFDIDPRQTKFNYE